VRADPAAVAHAGDLSRRAGARGRLPPSDGAAAAAARCRRPGRLSASAEGAARRARSRQRRGTRWRSDG
jgi:hypothetical protein